MQEFLFPEMGKTKRKIKHLEILKETAFIMFLYRADYLKYDFIPMNKRIRRVYGQNLNDTVCVVDPVMRVREWIWMLSPGFRQYSLPSRYTVRIPSRT